MACLALQPTCEQEATHLNLSDRVVPRSQPRDRHRKRLDGLNQVHQRVYIMRQRTVETMLV